MKAIIFCVETNRQANTDWVYIRETLDRFYKDVCAGSQVKFDRIYMGTKTKYKSKQVVSEIYDWKKVYKEDLVVIYCIDTDDYESNPEQKREFEDVQRYCMEKGYGFVWFCHDIEEVYWNHSIDNTAKKRESIRFSKSKCIMKMAEDKLRSNKPRTGFSNLLSVLDRYANHEI